MSESLPTVYLARHGGTAWSLTGQHTGLTHLPLNERGQRTGRQLGERLKGLAFAKVLTRPLQRARHTCELAGFAAVARVDADLIEWDYGEYKGRRTSDIRAECPNWQLFRDGCPGGESPQQVTTRADRAVSRVRSINADVLLFSSGDTSFGCWLAAGWVWNCPPTRGISC
jgi:broad specificity phosphatase PhoE